MREETQIRLWRYGLGIIFLILGISSYLIMDILSSKGIFSSLHGSIILIFLLFSTLASFAWSAILIGRCETFIQNKEYLK
jgi:hypothetical protein